MNLFLLYLWLKLDSFISTVGFLTFLCVFAPIAVITVCAIGVSANSTYSRDIDDKNWWTNKRAKAVSIGKRFWVLGAILYTVWVALPTQREGAYLIAGYAGMKLAETPEMTKLAELVRFKVGNYLDDELKNAKAEAAKAVASAVGK